MMAPDDVTLTILMAMCVIVPVLVVLMFYPDEGGDRYGDRDNHKDEMP